MEVRNERESLGKRIYHYLSTNTNKSINLIFLDTPSLDNVPLK